MLLDQEDEDWTALAYARYHKLTIKYDSDHNPYGDLAVPSEDQFGWDSGVLSDANIMDSVSTLIKERLIVSKDAAMLLRSMHDLQKAPSCAETTVDKYQCMRSLKQELPLLKTDIELDLASFGKSALPALKDLKIPSEVLAEENDEGLDWPSKYQAYPGQCAKQVKAEKLAVSRDVLLYLQDALTDHFSAKDSQKLVEQSLQRKTVSRFSTFGIDADVPEHCMSTLDPASPPYDSTSDPLRTIITS